MFSLISLPLSCARKSGTLEGKKITISINIIRVVKILPFYKIKL